MPKVFIPANGNVTAIATPAITLSRTRAPGIYLIAGTNGNPDTPATFPTFSLTVSEGGMIAPNSTLDVSVTVAVTNGVGLTPTTVITLSCSDPQAGNTAPVLGDYTCPYS